jgi:hypothetical protein
MKNILAFSLLLLLACNSGSYESELKYSISENEESNMKKILLIGLGDNTDFNDEFFKCYWAEYVKRLPLEGDTYNFIVEKILIKIFTNEFTGLNFSILNKSSDYYFLPLNSYEYLTKKNAKIILENDTLDLIKEFDFESKVLTNFIDQKDVISVIYNSYMTLSDSFCNQFQNQFFRID